MALQSKQVDGPECKIASNTDPTQKTSQRIDNVVKDCD